MKKLVEGKIALVTGGGAGMGACDCWKFAEEGAKGILIVDLNVDDAEKVAKEIYDRGVNVNPTLPPATPEGEALLRTSYMATHTEALLDEAMDIMAEVLVKHE